MPRSLWKGPFVHPSILKKMGRYERAIGPIGTDNVKPLMIRTWSRATMATPRMLGIIFEVHKGNGFVRFQVTPDKVGHKLGEFAPTRKFVKHPGQKVPSKVKR